MVEEGWDRERELMHRRGTKSVDGEEKKKKKISSLDEKLQTEITQRGCVMSTPKHHAEGLQQKINLFLHMTFF